MNEYYSQKLTEPMLQINFLKVHNPRYNIKAIELSQYPTFSSLLFGIVTKIRDNTKRGYITISPNQEAMVGLLPAQSKKPRVNIIEDNLFIFHFSSLQSQDHILNIYIEDYNGGNRALNVLFSSYTLDTLASVYLLNNCSHEIHIFESIVSHSPLERSYCNEGMSVSYQGNGDGLFKYYGGKEYE